MWITCYALYISHAYLQGYKMSTRTTPKYLTTAAYLQLALQTNPMKHQAWIPGSKEFNFVAVASRRILCLGLQWLTIEMERGKKNKKLLAHGQLSYNVPSIARSCSQAPWRLRAPWHANCFSLYRVQDACQVDYKRHYFMEEKDDKKPLGFL